MTKKGLYRFMAFLFLVSAVGVYFLLNENNETLAYVVGGILFFVFIVFFIAQKQYCPRCGNGIREIVDKKYMGTESKYNANQNRMETITYLEVEYACPSCDYHWIEEEKKRR